MRKHETYNENRELLRRSLININNDKDKINFHHKDMLVSISTQKSNYSNKKFERDLSIINRIINTKLIHRKFQKRPDRIVFYAFFERSKLKNILHSHMLLRVPRFIANQFNVLFHFIRHQILPKFQFSMKITNRPNIAIDYMSKQYDDDINDNYRVF